MRGTGQVVLIKNLVGSEREWWTGDLVGRTGIGLRIRFGPLQYVKEDIIGIWS